MKPNARSLFARCSDRMSRLAFSSPASGTGVAFPDFRFRLR
jgi:hypothetical protein